MYQVQCTKILKYQNFDPNTNSYFVLGTLYIVPSTWYLVLNSISNYSNKLIHLHLLYPLHPGIFPSSIAC